MSTQAVELAFPKVDAGSTALVVPPAPMTPANTGLAQIAASPEPVATVLVCHNLLVGDTLARAQADAAKLYAEMKANTAVFSAYGTDALTGVNQLIDRLLHEVEPTKIPELKQLMENLNREMRSIKRKYDVSDPKVRERYEKASGGVQHWWHHVHSMLDMLMDDVTSIETQIGKVAKDLNNRQQQLIRNVTYYDTLYEQNEQEIGQVIYVIAVMELIRELAANEAASITVGDASLGDRGGEQQASIAEFGNNMAIKIAEYKGRLMVAWATSPQVRMMRTLNVGLAERINELLCVTIPTMKATIVQWRMLIQTQDAASLAQAVADSSNEWLQAYSAAGAVLVPKIAETVQTPTLSVQSITMMADSINQQADGIVAAMEAGAKRRQEMDEAMITAQRVISSAAHKVSDAEIKQVLEAATKPLEIATSVPSSTN